MSGCGKTYWAKQLIPLGFTHICCDDLIEKKLPPELARFGRGGIQNVAKWLGRPYEPRFLKNQARYLSVEKEIMGGILTLLKEGADNLIIDTTGSVIYAGGGVCEELKKYTTIVYLKIPPTMEKRMTERYFKEPKPVLWDGAYKKMPAESDRAFLERCYPKLLRERAKLYERYAEVIFDCEKLRDGAFTAQDFLNKLL
jgi:shikimate kinase